MQAKNENFIPNYLVCTKDSLRSRAGTAAACRTSKRSGRLSAGSLAAFSVSGEPGRPRFRVTLADESVLPQGPLEGSSGSALKNHPRRRRGRIPGPAEHLFPAASSDSATWRDEI